MAARLGAGGSKGTKIRRNHSGCKPCRRRGKRCDEGKPICDACIRLSLDCTYKVDFLFHHYNQNESNNHPGTIKRQGGSLSATNSTDLTTVSGGDSSKSSSPSSDSSQILKISTSLATEDHADAIYFQHFERHVRHILPAAFQQFAREHLDSPYLRFAALCISASNLSMLDGSVQYRVLHNDPRGSSFSPIANKLHHARASNYHDLALRHCRSIEATKVQTEGPAVLAAQVILAYYHHASTNHMQFRRAVWSATRFVLQSWTNISLSTRWSEALQMWYRLCAYHRPSKLPGMLLEGEGTSSFGPNFVLPGPMEHLHLECVLGMNTDDLIYDILIKTIEIRTRMIVFRHTAAIYDIAEGSKGIGSLTHEVLNALLGRLCPPEELAEVRSAFLQGSHLTALLQTQRQRLQVWKSRVAVAHLPPDYHSGQKLPDRSENSPLASNHHEFPTHRVAMNALYYTLCELICEEANEAYAPENRVQSVQDSSAMRALALSLCDIAGSLDFSQSNTSDVYTFSLAETLLQLVFTWRSDAIFNYILDTLWPQIEAKGRGYEHSHYPTHLVKRIITQLLLEWRLGRAVTFALPAVTENVSKLRLLDIDHQVDLIVCGYDNNGGSFIRKIALS